MRKLVRALRAYMGFDWFAPFQLAHVAEKYGRHLAELEALMREMGPGDVDPETGTCTGDGVLDELLIDGGRFRAYRRVRRQTVAFASSETVATSTEDSVPGADQGPETNLEAENPSVEGLTRPILDTIPRKRKNPLVAVGDRVNAEALIQSLTPVLHDGRRAGEALYRVSLTMPPWNWQQADIAAETFRDTLLRKGARGVFLSKDISPEGAPHWYGLVVMHGDPSPKAARAAIAVAWIHASGANSSGMRIHKVSGWNAFVESGGDLDAEVGKGTFRTNLARVVGYAFKDWPSPYGRRDLRTDVVSGGELTLVGSSRPQARAAA